MNAIDLTSRVPPHSADAERSVLGSMLRDKHQIPEVQVILRPEQGDDLFYVDANRRIFNRINRLYQANSNVDLVLLGNDLHTAGEIDEVGGYSYLAKIYDDCPTAANATYYAQIVAEKAQQRWVLQLCSEWAREAMNPAEPGKLDEFGEKLIINLLAKRSGSATASLAKECHDIMDDFDKKPEEQDPGYPVGLAPLDAIFRFEAGQLTTVGARPSVGKSLGLLQFAHNLAEQGLPTLVFSLEMRRKENVQRLASLKSGVRFSAVRRKQLPDANEFEAISDTLNKLYKMPIYLNCEEQTITSIKAEVIRAKLRHKIKVVAIDYLQLVSGSREKGESRAEEVGKISKGLKRLANDHDLIVIAACQLNRETEKGGGRPKLSDLRESGSIEQDSDNVILLWKDETESTDGTQKVQGSVAKQRNGPVADFELLRNAAYMRFESRFTWAN